MVSKMATKFSSPNTNGGTRFSAAPMSEVEFSRMSPVCSVLTTFNGGDIVPFFYQEVLPHSTISVDLDYVIRQTTLVHPVMGDLISDVFAVWIPNRVLNESWVNTMGENTSGTWVAPEVNLAPLYDDPTGSVQIPVHSVADYYGFPTQEPIHGSVLCQCNDLKFRGYVEAYNTLFRSQSYQPPLSYSKLNVYNGFLLSRGSNVPLKPGGGPGGFLSVPDGTKADGSFAEGAIVKTLYGDGSTASEYLSLPARLTNFSALDKPLKACKLHDYFTSALPSPQKGAEVYFGIGDTAPVTIDTAATMSDFPSGNYLKLSQLNNSIFSSLGVYSKTAPNASGYVTAHSGGAAPTGDVSLISGSNLKGVADLSQATGISINELRTAIATQQVYETLARGGSRYCSEMLASFFGVESDTPFVDRPILLGRVRRSIDTYQVAQTSPTSSDSPQGTLAAYSYTKNGGHIFQRTFIEHGYIHYFVVVRQAQNTYTSYFAPDNFRRSNFDFYLPQLANISEQPIRLATLNPFRADSMEKALGFQEAWAEYRYEPDRVSGQFRSGINGSLDSWTLADDYDSDFTHINADWIVSNAEEVINRTVATTSEIAPQFKGQFVLRIDKQIPMPTYSVPGLDSI